MKPQHLSKQDVLLLLELIQDSLACRSDDALRRVMNRLKELLPLQAAISCISALGKNGLLESMHVVNVDYAEEYLAELGKQGLLLKDPVVIENFRSFRLQYWADTIRQQKGFTSDMKKIRSLAEDFGFYDVPAGRGYAFGICNRTRSEGSFFCYRGLDRSNRTEEILGLIVPHFHQALCRLTSSQTGSSPLTAKETEILKWIKEGKTTWDIAIILGISERTVKFHAANILRKLDASTRAHAVSIAIERKLIDID